MRIADFAAVELIVTGLDAPAKDALLAEMVGLLVRAGHVQHSEILMGELLKRERVMSTGIGGGIALPHALSDELDQLYMVFARTAQPIDFAALDAQPVDLIFMLVGPKAAGNMYVKLLARISRLLQAEEFKARLRGSATPEDILNVFQSEDVES